MNLLIQNAWAQDAAPSLGSTLASLLPFVLLFVFLYFLLIRPQQKRMKEHRQMVDSLAKGDEIITEGGLLGKITELGDNFIVLELAPNLEVKVRRQAIANVMPKGTMKTL